LNRSVALSSDRARIHGGAIAAAAAALLHAEAFTIGRHVFLSRAAARDAGSGDTAGRSLLAHELTHVAQYRRYGVGGFLARYLLDYASARRNGLGHAEAYAGIRFEREARAAERTGDGGDANGES